MSKRDNWEVTVWTKGSTKFDTIVQRHLNAMNCLFTVTTNCLEKNLRTEKTYISGRNVVTQKLYVDLFTLLRIPHPPPAGFSWVLQSVARQGGI